MLEEADRLTCLIDRLLTLSRTSGRPVQLCNEAVDLRDLASRTLRWGGRLMSGGRSPLPPAKSLVDTVPLREMLERELQADGGLLRGIPGSLADGWLRSFALTASSYTTGQSITWVQTREDDLIPTWERPQRRSEISAIRVDHVMASAALPFFFPAIEVDGSWYGDGGIRQKNPGVGNGGQVHGGVMKAVAQNGPQKPALRALAVAQQAQALCGRLFEHAGVDLVGLLPGSHVLARCGVKAQHIAALLFVKTCLGFLPQVAQRQQPVPVERHVEIGEVPFERTELLGDRRTGVLVEFDQTSKMFSTPDDERTEAYVTGRFG